MLAACTKGLLLLRCDRRGRQKQWDGQRKHLHSVKQFDPSKHRPYMYSRNGCDFLQPTRRPEQRGLWIEHRVFWIERQVWNERQLRIERRVRSWCRIR